MVNARRRYERLLLATNRPGIDKLLEYLAKKGFYEAPASTKYHNSYEGGLMMHSLKVQDSLVDLILRLDLPITITSATIASLLHDLCKVDNYISTPLGYVYNPESEEGHATKSIRIAKQFIELTEEEELAILYHMGAYNADDIEDRWKGMSRAYDKYPLVYWLHVADMRDSHNL